MAGLISWTAESESTFPRPAPAAGCDYRLRRRPGRILFVPVRRRMPVILIMAIVVIVII
jgi:hypothetical protein